MASGKLSSTGYMYLPHGTYDFICVNEQVTYHAATASFKVKRADALVAVVQGKLIDQDPKQYVDFELKHLTARVKIKLETYCQHQGSDSMITFCYTTTGNGNIYSSQSNGCDLWNR